jgi:hypothetical protein
MSLQKLLEVRRGGKVKITREASAPFRFLSLHPDIITTSCRIEPFSLFSSFIEVRSRWARWDLSLQTKADLKERCNGHLVPEAAPLLEPP